MNLDPPDGTIVQVVGNYTAHNFKTGSYVIVVNNGHEAYKNRYVRTYGVESCHDYQHLSPECFIIVGSVGLIGEDAAASDYTHALAGWIHMQTASKIPLGSLSALSTAIAQTQKARGLQVLISLGLLRLPLYLMKEPLSPSAFPSIAFPWMARPCPRTPRHGFVESRIVKNVDELNTVLTETKVADPYGEVVLMPPIKATYSAVVTDSAVTMGEGTDGATAGKKTITLPCNSNLREFIQAVGSRIVRKTKTGNIVRVQTLRFAGIRPEHGIFVETVGLELVQLRTGPDANYARTRYSTASNVIAKLVYIPKDQEDFLAYETYLDRIAKQYDEMGIKRSSIIIHLPHGSLSSHYAVQAITRGLSVITQDSLVEAGQEYSFDEPVEDKTYAPIPALRKGVINAIKEGNTLTPNALNLEWAVAVIQGFGASRHTPNTIPLIIAAGVLLARAGTGLCFGEHRHYHYTGPGKQGFMPRTPTCAPFSTKELVKCPRPERSDIYAEVFALPWKNLNTWYLALGHLSGIEHDFNNGPWCGGYGGPKWGQCTKATHELTKALLAFLVWTRSYPNMMSHNTSYTYRLQLLEVIAAANKLITLSHNSAKCLTKIIPTKSLLAITKGKAGILIATHPSTWSLTK